MSEDKEKKEKSFTFVDKRHRSSEEDQSDDSTQPEHGMEAKPEEPTQPESASSDESDKNKGASAPSIDFTTFILSLSSSAAYHMGGFQDSVSGKTSINLDLAKQTIDIVAILEEKTKGNLSEDESKLISGVLYDLRMKFIEVSKGAVS